MMPSQRRKQSKAMAAGTRKSCAKEQRQAMIDAFRNGDNAGRDA